MNLIPIKSLQAKLKNSFSTNWLASYKINKLKQQPQLKNAQKLLQSNIFKLQLLVWFKSLCYMECLTLSNKNCDLAELHNYGCYGKVCYVLIHIVFVLTKLLAQESRLFGATILVPPILLPDIFCTDHFGANSVPFDSSVI